MAWDDVPLVGMDGEMLLIDRINGESELRRLAAARDEAARCAINCQEDLGDGMHLWYNQVPQVGPLVHLRGIFMMVTDHET